ncbi:MAG: cysteine desulfurase [Candidatus Marinimicrobia bacterium]|nr:cysteine desulfurase [Candidatus Neomarinimicrobiota bacterium]
MKLVNKAREDFPILKMEIYGKPLVYLDNGATTQKPQCVIDRVCNYYKNENSNIHRGEYYLCEIAGMAYEAAREKIKNYINAKKAYEVIFTSGTTASINLLAHSLGKSIRENDEIIISHMEHHSNIIPWQVLCREKNANLKILEIQEDEEATLEALNKLITLRTRLISITCVSNALGTVLPFKKIIDVAHKNNIPVILDAAQAIQHMPLDVQDLDCDFMVFSGHKMYAGTGIGVLYGKAQHLEDLPPYQTGGGMIEQVSFSETKYAKLPYKFEAGTQNIAAAISLGEAVDYLTDIGLENIHEYEKELIQYASEQLNTISGIEQYSENTERAGAISFNIKDIHAYDIAMILDKLGIAVRIGTHCAEPLMHYLGIKGTIRASFGLYNTKKDIDRLIEGLKKAISMLQ